MKYKINFSKRFRLFQVTEKHKTPPYFCRKCQSRPCLCWDNKWTAYITYRENAERMSQQQKRRYGFVSYSGPSGYYRANPIGPVTRTGHFISGRGNPYKRGRYGAYVPAPRGLIAAQGVSPGAGRTSETKFVDVAIGSNAFVSTATPPTAISLCTPVQGAAAVNRIGQKITLKSIRIRGNVTPTATGVEAIARILVVYDKQANAMLPMWGDVIAGVTSAGAASNTITDGINMANRDRFIVLMDEQYNLPPQTYTGGVVTNLSYPQEKNPSMWNFDRYVKLKDMEVHFNNTNGGTYADIQTGSINMFVALASYGTANSWEFSWGSRTRFMG